MRRHRDSEEGVALFYALLVVLVVGGIIAVTLAAATTELNQSAFELDFEDTVHVAEAAVESTLQELPSDNDYVDNVTGPTAGQDEYAWAVAAATAQTGGVYDLPATDTGEGDAVGIRPMGTNTEFVYGVGFTPSRDAFVDGAGEAYARVVRVQVGFDDTVVPGDQAVKVDGGMTINSNSYVIEGTNGSLHANGKLDVSKDNTTQGLSYSGDCPSPCLGTKTEPEPIPLLEIEDPWGTDDAEEIAKAGDWYDYCAGQWYQRQESDTAPCTAGNEVAPPSGWSGLDVQNVSNLNAVFWIDDPGEVRISKVEGPATIIARGDITMSASGSADAMEPRYPGLFLFTEGDLDIGGNADGASSTPAIAYARGTLTLRGTMNTDGIAYLAKDAQLLGSGYKGGGAGIVKYDGGAQADLGGDGTPLVLRWEELPR